MIILINGSINSGKTTVSKIISKELKNTAHVEIDSLREFIDFIPLEKSIPINFENAVLVAKNFVKYDLNVVISYPISRSKYDMLTQELKDLNVPIIAFTLRPSLEIALKDRGERKLDDWEKERIKHHYDTDVANPTYGEVIDNSNQTPEETAKYILSKLDQ